MSTPRRSQTILVTGGAGFIGSHACDMLLSRGYHVRALDSLDPQVHASGDERPAYLDERVELLVGDVRNRDDVDRALEGVSAVVHLAAAVGVGQSMYEIERYTAVNSSGTATLLQTLLDHDVDRLIVASSMSIYGEGTYQDGEGRTHDQTQRSPDALADGRWDPVDDRGAPLLPRPTSEDKRPSLASIYALTKFDQEQQCLIFGRAYGLPTTALRFFNTYGPRQALSNPYTGVIAIFASRLLNGRPPVIFEDGEQQRDFVHVHDVARSVVLALESDHSAGHAINIGSGHAVSVSEIASTLARVMGCEDIQPEISGEYRSGDIRHCFADITRARELLGYEPEVTLEDGIADTVDWLAEQHADDRVDAMRSELRRRGLATAANGRPKGVPATHSGNGHDAPKVKSRSAAPAHNGNGRNGMHLPPAVLITGGCGFIGTNVAARFAEHGSQVILLDNFSREGAERNADWLRTHHGSRVRILNGDIRDRDLLRQAVSHASAVIHLAAQVAVTDSIEDPLHDCDVNVRGTLLLLEAMRAANADAHLLYTSTNKVYGNLGGVELIENGDRYEPADERLRSRGIGEERLCFESPYGCSKGAAEQYVLDYARTFGLKTSVFRMSCIHGPHQNGTEDQGWVAHFILQTLRNRPITIYGDGKQVRDILHVDDLVDAMLLALHHAKKTHGRAFNIGGGPERAVSLLGILDILKSMHGALPEIAFDDWRPSDQRYYVSDTSLMQQSTGWSPKLDLRDSIASTYDWLREHTPAHAGADLQSV